MKSRYLVIDNLMMMQSGCHEAIKTLLRYKAISESDTNYILEQIYNDAKQNSLSWEDYKSQLLEL